MNVLTSKMNKLHVLLLSTFELTGGVIYGFGIYTLIERGYSSFEAGICFALINIINLAITPIISNYLDNNDRFSIFDIIVFLISIIIVMTSINFFLDKKCLLLTLVFIVGNGCFALTDPIVNSVSSKMRNYNIDIPYSFARAFGSASYGVACFIFGFVSNKFSYPAVILGGLSFCLLYFVISLLIKNTFKDVKANFEKENIKNDDKISFGEFVKNNFSYIVICLFVVCIFIGYSSVDDFMILVCENVGGSSKDMGTILGFKAFLEVIPIFLFPHIIKKFKLNQVLFISVIAFVCKSLLFYLASNVFMLYVAELFQGLSFGLMAPGMVEYVDRYLKDREVVRGVSFFTLSLGAGGIIASFVSGYISNSFGVKSMVLFALIMSIIGAFGYICTLIYRNRLNKA